MDKWIKNLWNNNKIFFFLLLPLIALAFFGDVVLDFLISGARKMTNEAKKKDSKLKEKATKTEAKANAHKAKADAIGDKVKNRTEVDEDWYKDE